MPLLDFHPLTRDWFDERFGQPTQPQRLGWAPITAGRHTLIAAPTGSGKTLAAFLAAIDGLVRLGLQDQLDDTTHVLYVSPLKALSVDIQRNLQTPLAGIQARAGASLAPIRAMVRTGDTPSSQRQAMTRKPPHILVTTPESLYLLLTAQRSRPMLRTVRTVIVDEIHALARDKRGSHLALSLQRLEALCTHAPVRIGLSATQRPIEDIARFLVGTRRVDHEGRPDCAIVDVGHERSLDLNLLLPDTPLSAVCANETWDEIYGRLKQIIDEHHSTLVFVNTRRLAERVAHRLGQTLGAEHVASHHGSLSQKIRHDAETRLKNGQLKAIVATASLELGIDVGFIDLVCQIGSPRSIATLLQRVGRSGHALGRVPKGRLLPLTRDELVECLALLRAVRAGRLDRIHIPEAPLDILAQQIVATVAAEPCGEDELFELCRGAWPYRNLSRGDFDQALGIVSHGAAPGRKNGAYVHHDQIHHRLRPRRAARIVAAGSGGAIPDTADFRVLIEDSRQHVGSVNEDFALESMAGDVFILGNASWRIRHLRGGEVVVSDAHGAPATVPFWLGEAPGRTDELSTQVSDLREHVAQRTDLEGDADLSEAAAWVQAQTGADEHAAGQAAQYVCAQKAALGVVPTRACVVFERFFDDSGGMQLVVHAPFGARINRAWGLAMRKCFCRTFDFELQAAADDDGIVLSMGPQHSAGPKELFHLVKRESAEQVLTQALLAVPMFQTRWRWNATRALAVLRQQAGKKVPPQLQRFRADDLLSAVFPMQTACFEHRPPNVELPDHPLVRQTVHDCLHEAMDLDGWQNVLGEIENGRIQLVARDTREPSPFSHELLNANPYAFLDDAPLEERRARAVATRRTLDVESLRDLARLEPAAIEQVVSEAWPTVRDPDELHDALLSLVVMTAGEIEPWSGWFGQLVGDQRATVLRREGGPDLHVAAEQAALATAAVSGDVRADPPVAPLNGDSPSVTPDEALVQLIRGRLACAGPVTEAALADKLGLEPACVTPALAALEADGTALQGFFSQRADDSSLSPSPPSPPSLRGSVASS